MNELEPEFPVEFLVEGTPVSSGCHTAGSKAKWKERVKEASKQILVAGHHATSAEVAVTLYYFPPEKMQGDVDNIAKLVIDALKKHIYMDDSQVQKVTVQKFEPGTAFSVRSPSKTLTAAITHDRPVLYVRISKGPFEEVT